MTTNRDWLFSLPLEEQYAWMNAEHQERALDGDTGALNAKIAYPMHHGYKGVKADMVIFDELHDEHDIREKLEADAKHYIEYAADYADEDVLWADETFTLYDAIIELLDRQAAITEREFRKPNWSYCETCEALEKLTAERDNLEADCKDWMKHAMAAENVCHETEQEREQYRKLFGMALDWAHEITMLESSINEGMA